MKKIIKVIGFIKYLNFGRYLNWNRFFSWIFGAHNPEEDTEILESEEKTGVRYASVIRRSLWFSSTKFFEILFGLGILALNVTLLLKQNLTGLETTFINYILIFNIVYGVFVFLAYLFHFRQLYKEVPAINSIYIWIQKSKKGDQHYKDFFNQTITNMVIFITVFIYIIVGFFFKDTLTWFEIGLGILNVLLLIIQIGLLYRVKTKINNQEMDFCIITPNKLYVYDQLGYDNQDNNDFPISKVRNVKGTFGNATNKESWIGSILKFGTLIFLLDGGGNAEDGETNGSPKFTFTPQINKTKAQVALFIDKTKYENGEEDYKYKQVIHKIPVMLTFILYKLDIEIHKHLKKVQHQNLYFEEIKNFIIKNEDLLKEEISKGNKHMQLEMKKLRDKYVLAK